MIQCYAFAQVKNNVLSDFIKFLWALKSLIGDISEVFDVLDTTICLDCLTNRLRYEMCKIPYGGTSSNCTTVSLVKIVLVCKQSSNIL